MGCNTHPAFDVSPHCSVMLHAKELSHVTTYPAGDDAAEDPVWRGPGIGANRRPGRAAAGADFGDAGAADVRGTGSAVGGPADHRPRTRGAVRGHRVDSRRVVADLRARDAGRGAAP